MLHVGFPKFCFLFQPLHYVNIANTYCYKHIYSFSNYLLLIINTNDVQISVCVLKSIQT